VGDRNQSVSLSARWLVVCVAGAAWLALNPSAALARSVQSGPRLIWAVNEPARGIPALDAGSAYFLSHRHELLAASVTTGRVRWRVPMDSTSDTFGSRVVVLGDVVVAGDHGLVGVHRRTGRQLWSFAPADGGGAGIHLGDASQGLAFTGSLAGVLRAIDVVSGRPRWTATVGAPHETTVYSPVASGSLVAASFSVFGATSHGGIVVADRESGRIRWKRAVPGSSGASGNPVFAGRVVLVAARDGTLHAFDAESGDPRWTWPRIERLRDEQDYRPLAVSGGTVLAGSMSGEVVAHDLASGRILWRRTPSLSSVAFGITAHDGVVYVPNFSNEIVALRVSTGDELWRRGGATSQFRWVPFVKGPLLLATGSTVLSLFRHSGPSQFRGR
jgi:outer membrane protein assembly factor BamB